MSLDTSEAATADRLRRVYGCTSNDAVCAVYGVKKWDAGAWHREQDERALARVAMSFADESPVTEDYLRAENFQPDPDNPTEFAVHCEGAARGEHNSVVYDLADSSVAIECFDDDGHSLEVVSLGVFPAVGRFRLLCRAVKAWTASNSREGVL